MPKQLKPETVERIKQLAARYPKPDGALLSALRAAEREFGYIDAEACEAVANVLGMPPAAVWGVFSFYTTFRKETDGKHIIYVCSTLPCAMRGSERLFDHLSEKLGVGKDETTPDKLFTLKKAECLAACGTAPCMQINEDYYEGLTLEMADQILEDLRAGKTRARHVTP